MATLPATRGWRIPRDKAMTAGRETPTVPAAAAVRQRLVARDQRLPCPLTAVAGRDDDIYTADLIAGWAKHADDFSLELVEGGHLFIHDEEAAHRVVALIGAALQEDPQDSPIDLSERRKRNKRPAAANQ